jgi:hypothetical protein
MNDITEKLMTVSQLIEDFGRHCNLALALKPGEAIVVTMADGAKLHIEHDDEVDELHLYLLLGIEPSNEGTRCALYRQMLSANAFGHLTQGATLAIEEVSGEFMLCRKFALASGAPDALALYRVCVAMVNVGVRWQRLLHDSVAVFEDDPVRALVQPVAATVRDFNFMV